MNLVHMNSPQPRFQMTEAHLGAEFAKVHNNTSLEVFVEDYLKVHKAVGNSFTNF